MDGNFIGSVTADPVFIAVFAALVLSTANFAVGSFKAWANKTFELEAFDAWVRKDGTKLVPIFIYLGVGKALGVVDTTSVPGLPADLVSAGVIGYGLLQAGTYILATIDSIREAISPNAALKAAKLERADEVGDQNSPRRVALSSGTFGKSLPFPDGRLFLERLGCARDRAARPRKAAHRTDYSNRRTLIGISPQPRMSHTRMRQ